MCGLSLCPTLALITSFTLISILLKDPYSVPILLITPVYVCIIVIQQPLLMFAVLQSNQGFNFLRFCTLMFRTEGAQISWDLLQFFQRSSSTILSFTGVYLKPPPPSFTTPAVYNLFKVRRFINGPVRMVGYCFRGPPIFSQYRRGIVPK